MSLRDFINENNNGFRFQNVDILDGGRIDYDDFKIRIGQLAGNVGMEAFSVAIGNRAGEENLSGSAIAIGADAGRFDADATSISIGQESGQDGKGLNSVSMGLRSAQLDQGIDAVAIGRDAGNGFQSQDAVAVGREAGFSSQGTNSVAIGRQAGKTIQGNNSVAVGILAGETNQSIGSVAVGQSSGRTTQGQSAVAIGLNSGNTSQGTSAVAIGSSAGQTSQGLNSVAVGVTSGAISLGTSSVAVGDRAGRFNTGTNVVAIGRAAAEGSSINTLAGAGNSSIAIGDFAGSLGLRSDAIAIGRTAGFGTVDSTGNPINRLGAQGIAIGLNASRNSINNSNTIAIGTNSADGIIYDTNAGQGLDSLTIGINSGRFGLQPRTVVIGREAGEGAANVWTTRTTPTPTKNWRSITTGSPLPLNPATQSRFVAVAVEPVGTTDKVMYSDDGINWTITSATEDNRWRGISWSQDLLLYIAVSENGANRVMYSSDGITWDNALITGVDNSRVWFQSCIGTPDVAGVPTPRFVAVGEAGSVMYSDNGYDWIGTILASPLNQGWVNVKWSQELQLYVAVAFGGTSMYSSDGITWSNAGVSGLISNQWLGLTWAGAPRNRFVAVSITAESGGALNRVAYSDDGINWTMTNATVANNWAEVDWSPTLNLYCAVSQNGAYRTMTSADGILWTPRVASIGNSNQSIVWSSQLGLFATVAGTGSGNQVMTSNISLINRLGTESIAMGYRAGRFGINSTGTIAIGLSAGEGTLGSATAGQGVNAIAIGVEAGQTSQGGNAVSLGRQSGRTSQGATAVAIGNQAGQSSQGTNAIAIGSLAGQTSQANNTIILNATGIALNGVSSQTDSFYVAPIRQNNPQSEILCYNNTSREITRSNGDVDWLSPLNPSDAFFDITFGVGMSVSISDRSYVRIGRYIKGNMVVSWGVSGLATFGAAPALLLPSFVNMTVGSRIVGEFILTTSGTNPTQYSGLLVVNSANKDRAVLYLNRYNTSVPPPPFTNLQNISATTPDGSMQTDGVLEMTFDYISGN